jgi:hypothetical protein
MKSAVLNPRNYCIPAHFLLSTYPPFRPHCVLVELGLNFRLHMFGDSASRRDDRPSHLPFSTM